MMMSEVKNILLFLSVNFIMIYLLYLVSDSLFREAGIFEEEEKENEKY